MFADSDIKIYFSVRTNTTLPLLILLSTETWRAIRARRVARVLAGVASLISRRKKPPQNGFYGHGNICQLSVFMGGHQFKETKHFWRNEEPR